MRRTGFDSGTYGVTCFFQGGSGNETITEAKERF